MKRSCTSFTVMPLHGRIASYSTNDKRIQLRQWSHGQPAPQIDNTESGGTACQLVLSTQIKREHCTRDKLPESIIASLESAANCS